MPRTLPPDEGARGGPISGVIYWFYTEVLGVKPDASLYARHNNKNHAGALCHLMKYDPELDNTVYTPSTVGELIWYLIDQGVKVNDLSIVTVPGLLYNYTNRHREPFTSELERLVNYLKGKKSEPASGAKQSSFPKGW